METDLSTIVIHPPTSQQQSKEQKTTQPYSRPRQTQPNPTES